VLPFASRRTLDGSAMVPLGEQLFHTLPVLSKPMTASPSITSCRRATFHLFHQLIVGAGSAWMFCSHRGCSSAKELFGGLAIPSSGLVIENDFFHRMFLL